MTGFYEKKVLLLREAQVELMRARSRLDAVAVLERKFGDGQYANDRYDAVFVHELDVMIQETECEIDALLPLVSVDPGARTDMQTKPDIQLPRWSVEGIDYVGTEERKK